MPRCDPPGNGSKVANGCSGWVQPALAPGRSSVGGATGAATRRRRVVGVRALVRPRPARLALEGLLSKTRAAFADAENAIDQARHRLRPRVGAEALPVVRACRPARDELRQDQEGPLGRTWQASLYLRYPGRDHGRFGRRHVASATLRRQACDRMRQRRHLLGGRLDVRPRREQLGALLRSRDGPVLVLERRRGHDALRASDGHV